MKIVFISNYFNHHQKPFSDAMYQKIGNSYHFVETEYMTNGRKQLGWGGIEHPSYVIRPEEAFTTETQQLIDSADAVIIGSAPDSLVKSRIRKGKLVLRYSERPLKKGMEWKKYFPRLLLWNLKNPFYKPIYMLSASAYTADDYAKFGLFRNKCYKWGYFPETKRYDDVTKLISSKRKNTILWVARFLEWKHPEIPIEIAKRLKGEGYDFELNMIGIGELQDFIQAKVKLHSLEKNIHLLGSMSPEMVRRHMEQSEIFLFTSDRNEGWGAVLNESMNSGCTVVACRAIGSVPFLIEDGKNGYIYEDGDIDDLYCKVKYLLDHPMERSKLGEAAYRTIVEQWNAENAAERLLALATRLLDGEKNVDVFATGVCSKAEL